MLHYSPLICTPEIDSLVQASERAPLSLLSAAALCSKNVLLAEHSAELRALEADCFDDEPTPALTLVAMRVMDQIDDLMESLLLYDATLREHLRARFNHEMPF